MQKIDCNIVDGPATDADRERAREAAERVLADVDAAAAQTDWWNQIDAGADELTGLGAKWDEAERAANLALTQGWADEDGAHCEIVPL